MEQDLNKINKQVRLIYEEYKNDKEIIKKFISLLQTSIPVQLKSLKNYNIQNNNKIQQQKLDDDFIVDYMKKCNYYYCNRSEIFIHYNKKHFVQYSEDDILHEILSTLSIKSFQMNKYKVNKLIIKKIKDLSPLSIQPENETIYNVTQYFISCWNNRKMIKYFLCMIGDCLLKKKTNQYIYIVPKGLKKIIRLIDTEYYSNFGTSNILGNIKLKYYEHDYSLCRLIFLSYTGKEPMKESYKYFIDILNVSCYYSNKYGDTDNYLKEYNKDAALNDHILYLTKRNENNIIDNFVETSLTICNDSVIHYKDMLFIWKKYLEYENIPNIMFNDTMLQKIKTKIEYSSENEYFKNVTSIYLPCISGFTNFWEENLQESIDNSITIDELIVLFKDVKDIKIVINQEFIMDLISHYYPEVIIENYTIKYIKRVF